MKTYQEYYKEWQLSTESRDLAFDEWLMLQLDRQKQQFIEKACEWLEMNIEYWLYDDGFLDVPAMLKDFRKAMEE